MQINSLKLTNFRSWRRLSLEFDPKLTLIVGPNASGKTNIVEAVMMIATGRPFRAENDHEIISFNTRHVTVEGGILNQEKEERLRITMLERGIKRYFVSEVARRLIDFAGQFQAVLFWPSDLELVIDAPSLRRRFIDGALSQIDRDYRRAISDFGKVLAARNRLLGRIKEGFARGGELDFWDSKVADLGGYITQSREILFLYLNNLEKKLGPISWQYRPSIVDMEKLERNQRRDIEAGVTLSGPQRDDFIFLWENKDLSLFGSRGEQRISVLALKLAELEFLTDRGGERPVLILDDIFSELDESHRKDVLEVLGKQQTIVTTTDATSLPKKILEGVKTVRTPSLGS